MTPGVLARRRAEAQATIMQTAETLAARFGLDPSALTAAPPTRDTVVNQMIELEAVAGLLTALDAATVVPEGGPAFSSAPSEPLAEPEPETEAEPDPEAEPVVARIPGPPIAPPGKK